MTSFLASARWPRRTADDVSSDAELITRFLRRDDDQAFEMLVRRYEKRIFCLASSMLGYGRETEAEDVTQEIFVELFRSLRSFRRECTFSTWFYRLARNRIIDHRRRLIRRGAQRRNQAAVALPGEAEVEDALGRAISDQTRARLLLRIEQLPERQRIVIHLFYWQEQGTAEIAELLGQSPNTVKSHLYRARHTLARVLTEESRDD